jgi:trigger factor
LKVSIKNQGKCEKVLRIEVPSERVRKEYDKAYVEIAKRAKVPGFRPGHAPRNVLAMHYADNAKETVLQNLVEETVREALRQEDIHPIYYPSVSKVDFKGEELTFDAVVEVRPEVKLGNYKGLKAKKNKVTVEEKEFEDSVERIRESFAKFVPIEDRGAAEGDVMVCDLDTESEGKKLDSRKDEWFDVNSARAHEDLIKGVTGMKPGETRTVEVSFKKDEKNKEYAGKKIKFTVHLKEIKKRELPEVTDEWVKSLGEMKTVDEFKKRVREDLLRQKEGQEDQRFENELLEELLKQSKLEVSQAGIERRLLSLLEDSRSRLKMQGFPEDQIQKREAELKEKLRPEAEKQLKLNFIFSEIAKAENVKVEEADIKARYQEVAAGSKVDVERVSQYYDSNEEQKEALLNQIANEKILKVLKDNAKA